MPTAQWIVLFDDKDRKLTLISSPQNQKVKDMKDMVRLWVEFDEGLIKLKNATYSTRTIAGVRIPVLDNLEFELEEISVFQKPNWFLDGIRILKELTKFSIKVTF